MDAFGLGCLTHYCLTGGGHPFGARYERDANVARGVDPELEKLERVSREAADLVRALTKPDPADRPTAAEALAHPLWWSDAAKLKFLCDVSDRVEMEDREAGGFLLLRELERGALSPRGPRGVGGIGIAEASWAGRLPPSLLQNLGKYRSYKGDEVRDLLRVIRNKSNHFRELPRAVRDEVGAPPEGFFRYFDEKFPRLLMHAYAFVKENCAHEPAFRAYFFPSDEAEKEAFSTEASAAMAKSAERVAARAAARGAAARAAPAAPRRRWVPRRPGAPGACSSSRQAGVSSARGALPPPQGSARVGRARAYKVSIDSYVHRHDLLHYLPRATFVTDCFFTTVKKPSLALHPPSAQRPE